MVDRHVPLEGQPNFRDLGGYETIDGRTVKRGLVYRSGELSGLTARDLERLERLGIRTVVDLRSRLEVALRGEDRLSPGARTLALPIDPGDLVSALRGPLEEGDFSKIPADFLAQANRAIVREATTPLATLFQATMEPSSRPLVFHCTHGKDRAGVGAALLLLALGVPLETAQADYLLSNTLRGEENDRELRHIREAVAEHRGVAGDDVDLTNLEALFTVDESSFDAAVGEMVRLHGSVEAYLAEGLGITEARRQRLRAQLLE